MSAPFDPYHKWLGIPADEQPVSLYRLLGLQPFETDSDVIETAADQRLRLLKTFQDGPHGALSQKLLNEISRARQRLLDPTERAAYDALLHEQIKRQTAAASGVSSGSVVLRPVKWPEGKAPATLDEFFQCVAASGTMTVEQVRQFHERFPVEKQPQDPKGMATELVRAGKLTKYQAIALFQGKPKLLTFGEYLILEKLGQGGMGQVMKAEHRRMKRVVALKILSTEALANENAVRRFECEVHAAARLIHPNIVTAFDANEHEGVHYYVMEYVDGLDLKALSKTHGPLPVAMALDYVVQTARGLAYAHSKGIIHRDIKPANLLVDHEGTVKILDMGLARMDRDEDLPQLTSEGQVLGTIDFMAPEQAIDTHSADARADIYSLGCTFYRLLTGEALYSGETTMRKLMSHREDPIPSLTAKRPDVPANIDEVWRKMVAKLPEDRQQSMAEVLAALETCMYGKPQTTARPEGGGSVSYGSHEFMPVTAGTTDNTAASKFADDGLTTATVVENRTTQITHASEVTTNLKSGETDPDTMVSIRAEAAPPAPELISPATISSVTASPPRPAKGNRLFVPIAVGVVVAAALLIAGVVAFSRSSPAKPTNSTTTPAAASSATAAPSP